MFQLFLELSITFKHSIYIHIKTTLLLLSLFLAQFVYAQKFDWGKSADLFYAIIDANYKQNRFLISPLVSFHKIQKNNFLKGFELGYYKFKYNGKTILKDLTKAQIEKRISQTNRNMILLNFNCSKKVHFDQFIFIAGVYLPFTYSPKYTSRFNLTTQDANTNQITYYQQQTNQYPNFMATGIRFRTELNYPIYKKLHVASKLNFGFDYEHYFGKVNTTYEYFDGNNTSQSTRAFNYKSTDILSKHFSFGVGLNYFF